MVSFGRRQRQLGASADAMTLDGGETPALRELSVLLAENADLASERLSVLLGHAFMRGEFEQDRVQCLNFRRLQCVLALARFLAHSSSTTDEENRRTLWNAVLHFLLTFPGSGLDEFWESTTISSPHEPSFFSDLMLCVLRISEKISTYAEDVSSAIADIVPKVIELANRDSAARISPGIKSFLAALGEHCPALQASDLETVTKCLLDHWFLNLQRKAAHTSSAETPCYTKSAGYMKWGNSPLCNGYASPWMDWRKRPSASPNRQIKTGGSPLIFETQQAEEHLKSTASTTAKVTSTPTPPKLTECRLTPRHARQNVMTEYASRVSNVHSELRKGASCSILEEESLPSLERQDFAFKLSSRLFERSGVSRHLRYAHVHQLGTAAFTLLNIVLPLLKKRKQDWPPNAGDLKPKLDLRLQACHEAVLLHTRCLLLLRSDGRSKGFLKETFPICLDAIDACIASPWRRLKSCEKLCDLLIVGVAQVAVTLGNQIQRSILLRLKSVILTTCAQTDVSSTGGHLCTYDGMVQGTYLLLQASWNSDKSSVESFLSSLAAHIRETVKQGEKERQVVFIQTNLISFLSNLAEKFRKLEIVDIMLPKFIESFEQRDSSLRGSLRLKLVEGVARLGSLGGEKSYREVVVLLMQSYLEKVLSAESTGGRGLSINNVSEHLDVLTNALLRLARGLSQRLRADFRQRLLILSSSVGLAAESKTGRSGAKLLGPLLPAVAEICSDFDATQNMDPATLKLFRNFWYYVALFGLAPLTQRTQSSLRLNSGSKRSSNSTSSRSVTLQARKGDYPCDLQWNAAVTQIALATPPLVVSAVKWLEDEVELKSLHNPGSLRGSTNEKAVLSQRMALAAALGGLVETTLLCSISGVQATYLLAMAYLELRRLSYHGGVLRRRQTQGFESALKCVFKYLEVSDLLPVVQQCLASIVNQAFSAALSWLEGAVLCTEEQALENVAIAETHASFLIGALFHWAENVRNTADSLLAQLKARCPQVLWNPRCLDDLLCRLEDASQPASVSMKVIWNQRVREWMCQALTVAPCTVQGLLQEQFQKLNTWQSNSQTSHLLSLLSDIQRDLTDVDSWSGNINIPAVLAATAAAAGRSPFSVKGNNKAEILSSGILSANVKANSAGEIAGMKTLYARIVAQTPSPAGAQWSPRGTKSDPRKGTHEKITVSLDVQGENPAWHEMLTTRLLQLLQQFVVSSERGSHVDAAAFQEACLRGAALLLSETGNFENLLPDCFDQLLRLLCWCPAHIFTPEAMETGVFIWTWILTASPNLGSRVLAELVDAWLWTIDAGKGIFASGIKSSGPAAQLMPHLTPGEPGTALDKDIMQGIVAHYIWLGFLLDRYEVIRHVNNDQLFLITRLLQGSFQTVVHFSTHPAATGAFFKLVLFGLKFCAFQCDALCGVGSIGINLLEKRVYRAALGWFSVKPGWYDAGIEGNLQAEAQTMAMFSHYLMEHHSQRISQGEMSLRSIHGGGSSNFLHSQVGLAHPVWGKAGDDHCDNERRKHLLLMLCRCEADRLTTWAHPINKEAPRANKVSSDQWSEFAKTAWKVDPCIALAMVGRFPAVVALRAEVTALVQEHLTELYNIPEALLYFVTPKAVEDDSSVLQLLSHWAPCAITTALEFLTPAYQGHHRVMAYVLRVMDTYSPERVTFFMPQLVQSLRYDQKGLVEGYLMVAAQRSNLFAHILIWQLQGEEAPPAEEASKDYPEIAKNNLYDIVPKVRQRIIESFAPEAHSQFLDEFAFFDKVTSISGVLYHLPRDERRPAIRRELERIQIETQDLYLPTAPKKLVRGIQLDSGIPLQSAAKVPIMIAFDVIDKDGDPSHVEQQACIFKVGDDCRQDVLALQVIALLRDIFEAVGINLYLFPYGVLPTGCGRGIIEVVTNTRSRSQMAEITDGGFLEVFQQDFGAIGSEKFEAARENFISSSAGYAVACLLLQPKDRHNGNLLFDKEGRMVHIDFGFILETSPGGNMRFESAQFKLSHEMTQLLDPSGVMKSQSWYRFLSLSVMGYLAARQHMDAIINTVVLMKDSGLPCFSRGDPIGNLRKRFHPEMNEREAANFMIKVCEDAYNKWTTVGYDLIQYLQQGIEK